MVVVGCDVVAVDADAGAVWVVFFGLALVCCSASDDSPALLPVRWEVALLGASPFTAHARPSSRPSSEWCVISHPSQVASPCGCGGSCTHCCLRASGPRLPTRGITKGSDVMDWPGYRVRPSQVSPSWSTHVPPCASRQNRPHRTVCNSEARCNFLLLHTCRMKGSNSPHFVNSQLAASVSFASCCSLARDGVLHVVRLGTNTKVSWVATPGNIA